MLIDTTVPSDLVLLQPHRAPVWRDAVSKHQQSYSTYTTMAPDKTPLVRLYINRLVNTLVPSSFGAEYTQSLVSDLLAHLESHPSLNDLSLPQLLDQFKMHFSSQGKIKEWLEFQTVVELLARMKLVPQIASYLEFLSAMAPESTPKQKLSVASHTADRTRVDLPHHGIARGHVPMAKLIEPIYNTLDESVIIENLQHALLGQDSKLLPFSHDPLGIEIPALINISYSRLLADILEPALLFKRLSTFLESSKGHEPSPIKTAFLRFLDSSLKSYTEDINTIYLNTPSSLLSIYNALQENIQVLRLLGHIQTQLCPLSGYEFLVEVHTMSKFGDSLIASTSSQLFLEIVVPYYDYIQHWLIKGDLIDENDEFFVAFNISENHINDIIEYKPTKLPTFLSLDKSLCKKILEIGKTLVFLKQYCQELTWVNDFAARHSNYIFGAHNGLASMKPSTVHELINAQYSEVMNYLTLVMQSKHQLFLHLTNYKQIMFMKANDFIEFINDRGAVMFNEPAATLTSGYLSELLIDSVNASSVKTMPAKFKNRIDARVLDLSHGTIGWDVFTLEYKVPEPALDALLNYRGEATQYLRIFNFLWSLRHFHSLLMHNKSDFQNLQKNELAILRARIRTGRNFRLSLGGKRVEWFLKSVRTINLIRHKFLEFMQVMLKYLSFDLIEDTFNDRIVRRVFRTRNVMGPGYSDDKSTEFKKLPVLNKKYQEDVSKQDNILGFQGIPHINHNMNEYTIDEITSIHHNYLQKISECKLISEAYQGRHSGVSLIDQIFEFLEISFAFVKSSEEFCSSLSNYISILNYNPDVGNDAFDDDLEDLYRRLDAVMKIIYNDLYVRRYQAGMEVFLRDLRADVELKDLCKLLA